MDEDKQARENLKQILRVGVTTQTIAGVVSYALTAGKKDFIEELDGVLKKFTESLSDQEKAEVKKVVEVMVDGKLQEMMMQMGEKLSEEELADALKVFEEIAQAK